jgi:hypothetical protein
MIADLSFNILGNARAFDVIQLLAQALQLLSDLIF